MNFLTVEYECLGTDAVGVYRSTYEDEVIVPNYECSAPRTGTSIDRNFGCYVANSYETTFFYGYLDTTFTDSISYFNASVGITGFNIQPGVTYQNSVYFWAYGQANPAGKYSIHNGQIGTFIHCGRYWKDTSGSCVFSVDTSKVQPNEIWYPI